ncbi:hypothetical protein [Streptomyces sp. NPDC046161]|uniref:hypothetical protein n=1 Tax=Streptomyces sp. NPDC046161 TaxID=3155132 RepID=UPI0033D8E3C3
MSDSADLICFSCRIVLPIGMFWNVAEPRELFLRSGPSSDDPLLGKALWRFLAEHVYHQVELLGEGSEHRWESVDADFITIDDEEVQDPTLEQYVDEWPGRTLAMSPRPLCEATRLLIRSAEQSWASGPGTPWDCLTSEDHTTAAELNDRLVWPESFSTPVDAQALTVRLFRLGAGIELLAAAADRPLSASMKSFLAECRSILLPAGRLGPDGVIHREGSTAPPSLFDAERALGLIGGFFWWAHPSGG